MNSNCMKCKHFYITYDKNTPRGCKIYGIQSAKLPSIVIKNANSGKECIGFEEKQSKAQSKALDFNDPKLW